MVNSLLASVIDPTSCYLDCLIVPKPFYHRIGFTRAFDERLEPLQRMNCPNGYRIQPLKTLTTTVNFPSTLTPPATIDNDKNTLNATAVTSITYVQGRPTEVVLGGVKMGNKFPPSRLQAASCLSRARMGLDFLKIVPQYYRPQLFPSTSGPCTYATLKDTVGRETRVVKTAIKEALGGWVDNDGDDFELH